MIRLFSLRGNFTLEFEILGYKKIDSYLELNLFFICKKIYSPERKFEVYPLKWYRKVLILDKYSNVKRQKTQNVWAMSMIGLCPFLIRTLTDAGGSTRSVIIMQK